jgi:hypothetical protein
MDPTVLPFGLVVTKESRIFNCFVPSLNLNSRELPHGGEVRLREIVHERMFTE